MRLRSGALSLIIYFQFIGAKNGGSDGAPSTLVKKQHLFKTHFHSSFSAPVIDYCVEDRWRRVKEEDGEWNGSRALFIAKTNNADTNTINGPS